MLRLDRRVRIPKGPVVLSLKDCARQIERAGLERAAMAAAENVRDAWTALRMIRETLEAAGPVREPDLLKQSVAPVTAALKAASVTFAGASAYDDLNQMGGVHLDGVPNVGKPTRERLLLATLKRLREPMRVEDGAEEEEPMRGRYSKLIA